MNFGFQWVSKISTTFGSYCFITKTSRQINTTIDELFVILLCFGKAFVDNVCSLIMLEKNVFCHSTPRQSLFRQFNTFKIRIHEKSI